MRQTRAARVEPGTRIPIVTVRAALLLVACTAFGLVPPPYSAIAIGLAVIAAAAPATMAAWGAALVIAVAQLAHPAAAGDWRPYAAVAVVHLLHVLGGLALALPVRGWMQVRALWPTARRWLLIEAVAQPLLAFLLLARAAGAAGLVPAGAVAVGTAVCALVIVLLLRSLTAGR